MIKTLIVGRRRPGTTLAAHRRHMRDVHGSLVLQYIAADPAHAPQRYVQNHAFDGLFRGSAVGTDPFALARDFVTEIYFDDLPAMIRSRQQPFYLEHLSPDEPKFVDQATVVMMPVREQVIAGDTETDASIKLFVFLARAEGTDAATFQQRWSTLMLDSALELKAVRRQVRNQVMGRPGEAPLLDVVEEFWLADEDAAQALAETLMERITASLVADGSVTDGTPFLLMAHEYPMFRGHAQAR